MTLDSSRDLSGKKFVFFGGTSGIGQAAAEALAARHAHIAVVGRTHAAGEATVQSLKDKGATEAVFIQGDLSTIKGARDAATSVQRWNSKLDGIVHSAMSAFSDKKTTSDGLEFAFALQYEARVIIDNLLLENLTSSGDGRIVHLSGAVPAFIMPDLDDLQFEKSSFSFWKAILGTHNLGFMFIQEAQKRWKDRPISIIAVCVGSTKTKVMTDSEMPFLMRLMGRFGTTPELSAQNIVKVLGSSKIADEERFGIMWDPKKPQISKPVFPDDKAEKLWEITSRISGEGGVALSAM